MKKRISEIVFHHGTFLGILFGMAVLSGASAARAQTLVESVRVNVRFTDHTPPEPMIEKIRFSVGQVGIKALKGKNLTQAQEVKPELTELLEKIFNQVLGGYLVKSADVTVSAETSISLVLEPITPFVKKLTVSLDFEGGIHPVWNDILSRELEIIRQNVEPQLNAIPVLSARWSQNVLAEMLPGILTLNDYFPGFTVEPRFEIDENTILRLRLTPADATIRQVSIKVRSNTMPSLALEQLKLDAAARADMLIGLPLKMVVAEKKIVITDMSQFLSQSHLAKSLGLDMDIKLIVGRNSRMIIIVDSHRFSGFLRAKISAGREENNPDADAHFGLFLFKNVEGFGEINFLPGPIEMRNSIGLGWRVAPFLYAATGRNVSDNINRVWLNCYLSEDVIITWEKGVHEDPKKDIEGSLRFKAHEFFSFDLVSDFNTDIWVRFNVNL